MGADFCGTTYNIMQSNLTEHTLKMVTESNHPSDMIVLKCEHVGEGFRLLTIWSQLMAFSPFQTLNM